ncbi:hypothetical protein [Streptomyces sp. NPDC059564]|uniref:hypothetical protein n=1 Tax=Streptomyces sp. NPDC059564 TaxID=3346865 RepID=UPI0036A9F329
MASAGPDWDCPVRYAALWQHGRMRTPIPDDGPGAYVVEELSDLPPVQQVLDRAVARQLPEIQPVFPSARRASPWQFIEFGRARGRCATWTASRPTCWSFPGMSRGSA